MEWPRSLGWWGEALVIREMQNRTSRREHLTPTAKVIIKRLKFPNINEDVRQCNLSHSSRRSWKSFNRLRLQLGGILTGHPESEQSSTWRYIYVLYCTKEISKSLVYCSTIYNNFDMESRGGIHG